MKKSVLIFYNSKRGSTKTYADWIEKGIISSCDEKGIEVVCEKSNFAETNLEELKEYDVIIFGSWLRGSGIVGLNSVKPYIDGLQKRTIIYCCGISEYNPANYAQIMEINFNDKIDMSDVKLYYCIGAYDPNKVKGIDRLMMWIAKKILIKGTIKEESDAGMRMKKIIEEGADLKDEKYARQVIKGAMEIIEK
ncbi:flavodoxin domain-containing protein [Alterileibacterium massiliense]|uniref:flavodoxin domain-containing protein n=1 Tax=Alterileibacterium massiliense TaxID=1870997 RepID=UPI0008DA3B2E|nr:flavodoxin domain-containing protein [Alterileibacterium massiliense]